MILNKFKNTDGISLRGRLVTGVLTFSCLAIIYMQRANFNVIVPQVVKINNSTDNKYLWTQMQKSLALMSFYAGYWFTQIPGGVLADKYGSKVLLGIAVFCSSICCFLTPLSITKSPYFSVGIRIILGLAQGLFPPCFLVVIGNWYPQNCRSSALGFIFPGTYFGTILAMIVPSALAVKQELWGVSFYIFGTIGLLWLVFWMILYNDNPSDNKCTKLDEKKFILENIDRKQCTNIKEFPVMKALKSKPIIAIIVCHIVATWSLNIIITLMPSLIRDLYFIEVKDQTYITFLSPILTWIGGNIACVMFDYILRKHTITKIKLRKILNIFCLFPTGLFFMFATLISPSKYQFGIFLLLIASFFSGFEVVVSMPNIGDIAPQYTGIIFGFVNTIATVAAICSVQSSYAIVSDTHRPREWQILFGILIIIQVVGFIIFTMWGEGTIQKWAIPKEKTDKSELKTNL